MAEEFRSKFVSWSARMVKEIKEIPAKNNNNVAATTQQGNLYGVGINLAIVRPAPPSSSAVVSSSSSIASPASHNRVGVDSVHPAGPAARSGLRAGDVIVEATDGTSTTAGRTSRTTSRARYAGQLTREPIGCVVGSHPPPSPGRRGREEKDVVVAVNTQQGNRRSDEHGSKKRQHVDDEQQRESKPPKAEQGEDNIQKKKEEGEKVAMEPKETIVASTNNNVLDSLESLALSEEEHKERDLTSSAEDVDQFDDMAPGNCCGNLILGGGPLSHANSVDEIAEEKTDIDNEDNEVSSIMNNSIGDDESSQWEMISERSGCSAMVISFNGSISGTSFRSASPSMLKNKFVLTESTEDPYIQHVVLPTDTLQGLCLAYKISATRLRMENGFSGNSLRMAPKRLRIPNNAAPSAKGTMIRTQDTTSREYKLYAFVADMPLMELVEAKAYLDLSNWDLDEALRSAREDDGGWSMKGGFEPCPASFVAADGVGASCPPVMLTAVVRPKALTAQDIYAAPPPFDGEGFELNDISKHGY
eukprot:CAMPEP_0181131282 /NCGR_PEP_ID=MMETSP1071-20121207/30338_1 /TAXON_ID=35127 /ORGANISM="Thalassiosira sp., Strain NH16" /LENGTH=530 /DNA_ID=CAMNT_0023217457 /DNA_START=96 /DNA_END=1689 /DNA_ORIENTATION=+